MKIKHLLIGMLAMAAAAACQEKVPVVEPVLDVDKTEVSVAATAAEATFNVTANNAWTATADADWVTLDPAAGEGGAEAVAVKVTAEDNTAEEARTATVTVKSGELTKTVKVAQAAKTATEEPEPEPTVSYGICGAIVDNEWGTAADVVLTADGDWLVAKSVDFKEINFKIRGNNDWADEYKWARATADQPNGKLHEVIAVLPYTEYVANGNTGDNPNIYVGAAAGKYDVYFSPEKKEVWVMMEGYKPGDALPEVETTWGLIGVNGDWSNDIEMTLEEDYYVAKNVKFNDDANVEFKIRANKAWVDDTNMGLDKDVPWSTANTAISVVSATTAKANGASDAGNIGLADVKGGTYDIYYDAEGLKVWVMTAGYKPGETPAPAYTLDGKQWLGEFDGMPMLVDLGLLEEGAMVVALPLMDNSGFGLYMSGTYELAATDGASGTIEFTQYDAQFDEFLAPISIAYSNLGEKNVDIASEALFGTTNPVTFTLVETPYEIDLNTGGNTPAGEVEDGVYWFIEPTSQKVLTPLGETQSYGRPSAADAIDGASTAKNAFTLTYNPDWSCYTIQDSYGRYLYQGMQSDGTTPYRTISVGTTLPSDEETLAFYMWTVYNNGNGTYDVYNCATYYSITYSASYDNWEIYDPYEDDFANLFPSLVKADNPVEEPAPEEPAAGSVVFDWATLATTTDTAYTGTTVDGVTLTGFRIATNKAGQLRIYAPNSEGNAYVKLASDDKKITKVEFTFTGSSNCGPLEADGYADGVWTGSANEVTFTNTGSAQARVTKIVVTLE